MEHSTKVLEVAEMVDELERIAVELETKGEWSLATNLINVKISLILHADHYGWGMDL